jgi:hypothetical protein
MAKKKNKKKAPESNNLEFKEVFLSRKMHGKIQGLELPKLYKDFTAKDKLTLYWHNPENTKVLFKDVSFVGPRSIEDEKEQEPKLDNDEEQQEETNTGDK